MQQRMLIARVIQNPGESYFSICWPRMGADEIRHETQYRPGDIRKVSHFRTAEVHADHITGKNPDRSHKKREKETALFPELPDFLEFRIFCDQPLGEVQL